MPVLGLAVAAGALVTACAGAPARLPPEVKTPPPERTAVAPPAPRARPAPAPAPVRAAQSDPRHRQYYDQRKRRFYFYDPVRKRYFWEDGQPKG